MEGGSAARAASLIEYRSAHVEPGIPNQVKQFRNLVKRFG